MYENVELPLIYTKAAPQERKARVEAMLEKMDMAHRAKHFPQQSSSGQQQRVAVENQRAGKTIKPVPKKTLTIPAELNAALKKNAKLKQAFNALTPGKQREYADHVGSAKQEKTRCPVSKKLRLWC